MSEPCPWGRQNVTFLGDRVIAALIRKDEVTLEQCGPPIRYNWDAFKKGKSGPRGGHTRGEHLVDVKAEMGGGVGDASTHSRRLKVASKPLKLPESPGVGINPADSLIVQPPALGDDTFPLSQLPVCGASLAQAQQSHTGGF